MQLQSFLLIIQVILALSLISLILLQHGRGAQAGAAFGSGASSTVFGARGSVPFLVKITTVLAIVFFINSLGLAYISAKQPEQQSLIDQLQLESPEGATPALIPADVPADEAGAGGAEIEVPADLPVDELPADGAKVETPADVPPVE
jgi:preprotein translocase subunit SecG